MTERNLVDARIGFCMRGNIISPELTIAELEEKARECEERAGKSPEPEAMALREEAKQYLDWARSLGSGAWIS